MDGLVLVKASDLERVFEELKALRIEIRELKESEDELKAYSIQQTADLLNLHYGSVRKLVLRGKLDARYLEGDSGKCVIPLRAIKAYLQSK